MATVDLLTGDGSVVAMSLPTTAGGVQQSLAPVGTLAGVLLGEQASGTVTQLTNGVAPAVATVTSTVDQVAAPLLGTLNAALAPVTEPLVGGLTGGDGGSGPLGASLIGADVGGNVLPGPTTSDTLVGVNLLPSGAAAEGQLLTANALTQGVIADVTVPTTAAGVEGGLQPVGNLAGALLGPQAGAAVDQVTAGLAPSVASVTAPADSLVSPVLDAVNGLAPALPGGGSGATSPLAPVTDALSGVLPPAGGGGDATAPLTGLLGGLLGN